MLLPEDVHSLVEAGQVLSQVCIRLHATAMSLDLNVWSLHCGHGTLDRSRLASCQLHALDSEHVAKLLTGVCSTC